MGGHEGAGSIPDYELYTGNGMRGGLRDGSSSFMNRLDDRPTPSTISILCSRYKRRQRHDHAPEDLHVDVRLEHDEEVGVVMGVHFGAAVAEVLRAIRAVEPLSGDMRHAPVAHGKRVRQ